MSDTVNLDEPPAQIDTVELDGFSVLAAVSGSETHALLSVAFNEINGINFEFTKLGMAPFAAVKAAAKDLAELDSNPAPGGD